MEPQKTFSIFTGDDKTMPLKAVLGSCTGGPLDLTSCTQIDVALPNADGTFAHRLLTEEDVAIVSPALLGKFTCSIPSDVSALLNPGELQNIDVTFTIAAKEFTVRFFAALSVYERD